MRCNKFDALLILSSATGNHLLLNASLTHPMAPTRGLLSLRRVPKSQVQHTRNSFAGHDGRVLFETRCNILAELAHTANHKSLPRIHQHLTFLWSSVSAPCSDKFRTCCYGPVTFQHSGHEVPEVRYTSRSGRSYVDRPPTWHLSYVPVCIVHSGAQDSILL
jgi:hypothetical protein